MKIPVVLAAATLAASAFAAVPASAATVSSPLADAPSNANIQTVAYGQRIIPPNRFGGGQRFMGNRFGGGRNLAFRNRFEDRWGDRDYRWRNRWGWGGAFALGVGPDYVGPAYGYGYDTYDVPDAYAVAGAEGGHVQYCLSRYRSYDPATDSFIGYDGFRHPCVGPY